MKVQLLLKKIVAILNCVLLTSLTVVLKRLFPHIERGA